MSGRNSLGWWKAMSDSGLAGRVLLFSRFLKDHGFKIFSSNIVDTLESLKEIDVGVRGDFFYILRANLVTSDLEWQIFGDLFEEFWHNIENKEVEQKDQASKAQASLDDESIFEVPQEVTSQIESRKESVDDRQSLEGTAYSPISSLEKQDLGRFEKGDIQIAQLILKNIMSPFRTTVKARFKKSKRPSDIDFRRIIRKSLKSGGIPLELFYRKKKKRLKRLVILADVSGSMDRYARFVMPFILGLRGIGPRAEVFVFSTSLTPVTPFVRRFDVDRALEIISEEVPDWSGGTRIGYSLHQFNEKYGDSLLNRRTVLVIMSDGWDLGGRELLKREMEYLNQKAHCIIWLNPLAGDPDYKPLARGMQTALPFVDHFLPANSLQSLKRVGKVLSKAAIH